MSLVLTDEQRSLGDAVRRFVAHRTPLPAVRTVLDDGREFDADVWRQLSEQLELPAMAVPKEFGGHDYGQTELCVVFRELGRALVPSPLLGSAVLAAQALVHCADDEQRRALLPAIAAGTTVATLAVSEAGSQRWAPDRPGTTATPDPAGVGHHVHGRKTAVLNARSADVFLVLADDAGVPALFVVAAGAPGVHVDATVNQDRTRPLASVTFDGAPAHRVAGPAGPALTAAALYGSLAVAAEQVGATETCLDMTAGYAGIRYAFGNPIGAFQGVKHPLAQTKVAVELGYSLLLDAAGRVDAGAADAVAAVHAARSFITAAYLDAGYDVVQLHGGIGYTWEHDAHLFYKNATFSGQLLGGPAQALDALAELLFPATDHDERDGDPT